MAYRSGVAIWICVNSPWSKWKTPTIQFHNKLARNVLYCPPASSVLSLLQGAQRPMAWHWQREQDLPLRFLALDDTTERLAAKDMEASYQSTSLQKEKKRITFYFVFPPLGRKIPNSKGKGKKLTNYLTGLKRININ